MADTTEQNSAGLPRELQSNMYAWFVIDRMDGNPVHDFDDEVEQAALFVRVEQWLPGVVLDRMVVLETAQGIQDLARSTRQVSGFTDVSSDMTV